jgi:hypothetical protein
MKKYLYFRGHSSYEKDNIVKFGSTTDIVKRNGTYKTGEYTPGYYIKIIEIDCDIDIVKIEKFCNSYYKKYHKYINGGDNEFYDKKIIDEINDFLNILKNKIKLNYRILSKEEIDHIEYEYIKGVKELDNEINLEIEYELNNLLKENNVRV